MPDDVSKELQKSQRRLATLSKQLEAAGGQQSILARDLTQDEAAALLGHDHRNWVRKNVPKTDTGGYDARIVVEKWVDSIRSENSDESPAKDRRLEALADRAELAREMDRLKLNQQRGDMLSIEDAERIFDAVAGEFRKALELVRDQDPALQQTISAGLDNALNAVEALFSK